jgi:hypothetical protein
MNTPIEDPDHKEISYVVDGRTGEAFSPAEYAQRSQDQVEAKMSQRFIKGPIPLPWLVPAFALTPSALKCALALFYQRGLSGSDEFKVEPKRFRELGIDDTARRRGLRELEEHGLIRLNKEQSKSPVVCILTYPPRIHHQK